MSYSFYFMFDARTALLDRNVAVQYFVYCCAHFAALRELYSESG